MLRLVICVVAFVSSGISAAAQEGLIKIEPVDATGDSEIRIIYDATKGESALAGSSKIYMHSGVIISGPAGTTWENVVGNWGMDDGLGEMSPVTGETDQWEITLSPSIRDYYNVSASQNIFRLAMVFRNADGSKEGKGTPGDYSWGNVNAGKDIFVDLTLDSYVQITTPAEDELFINSGESISLAASASSDVSSMAMKLDEGSGPATVAEVSSGTSISYSFEPAVSGDVSILVEATIGGVMVSTEKTISVNLVDQGSEVPLPDGVQKGINYTSQTEVVLVLEAPMKEFVYAVGDFSEWETRPEYLMNKAPDTDLFWVRISGLVPGKKYVFQYWVDGTIKIGDPFADEVVDKDNDTYIPSRVFPDPAPYTKDYGIATVLQTGQNSFSWNASETSWTAPDKENLVVYELLIRDFLGSHSYDDLIDTLTYLDRLGVNALELMPIMEFEGNSSWGYNPSYFFAVDKYYGTKADFKRFVQAAHAKGMAVIMDMVLNHAFGQNALVRMYPANGPQNPWFNTTARHPYNVGYDFNHESTYTQNFVDSVNTYWMSEFHIDGYRYDLSKGFTQTNYCTTPGCDTGPEVGAWSSYDASRIAILKRMAGQLWNDHPEAYVILEHFAEASEENELAEAGMMLWNNRNFVYGEALAGITSNSFSGAEASSRVTYMESHDEERTMYEAYQKGLSTTSYDAGDTLLDLERQKMNAAFLLLLPGPKMIWQFGELGYDVLLNGSGSNGRLAEKPLPWGEGNLGYYEDPQRQYLYKAFSAILQLRNSQQANLNGATYTYELNGADRKIVINGPSADVLVAGNFGISNMMTTPGFTHGGTWYDYFSGEEFEIEDPGVAINYEPGEFHIYSDQRLSDGFPDVVKVFQNPVSVSPASFTKNDAITIRFDASRADAAGSDGLVGSPKVFMYSGIVLDGPSSKKVEMVVDDASAEMSPVASEENVWEITLTPSTYYGLVEETPIYRIGLYFRNEGGDKVGKGFRGEMIYLDVLPDGNIITISPAEFSQNDEITLTYDARFGPLSGASKIYMHSGVVLSDKSAPTGSDWEKVIGTWGTDNGTGEMTPVSSSPGKWQMTFTPKSYYALTAAQQAYWLALVFRNADGSVKATGNPDTTPEGMYIAENGDIYIRVPTTDVVTGTAPAEDSNHLELYPNPGTGRLQLRSNGNEQGYLQILNSKGQIMLKKDIWGSAEWEVTGWNAGVYLVVFTSANGDRTTRKLLIAH